MCVACELKERFGWIEEAFTGAQYVNNKLEKVVFFVTHSYPDFVDLEPYIMPFLETHIPDDVDLEVNLYPVEPGCRDLFDNPYKQRAFITRYIREEEDAEDEQRRARQTHRGQPRIRGTGQGTRPRRRLHGKR